MSWEWTSGWVLGYVVGAVVVVVVVALLLRMTAVARRVANRSLAVESALRDGATATAGLRRLAETIGRAERVLDGARAARVAATGRERRP